MDTAILFAIRDHLSCVPLDYLFHFLTILGNLALFWCLLSAGLCLKKSTRYVGLVMLIAIGVTSLLVNFGLKPIVYRTRPYLACHVPIIIKAPGGTSFPSGHAAVSFACATVFCLNYWKSRKGLCIALVILAFGIAFSRIYLFVHYPSDVLAGMVIGVLIGLICQKGSDRLIKNRLGKPSS